MTATADAAAGRGETPMYVAIDDRLAAVVTVADTVKPSRPRRSPSSRPSGSRCG